MKTIVVYKSKYGATKAYAEWISEELGCECVNEREIKATDLLNYSTIIYGGGLYAEIIAGVTLITKNYNLLKDKKLIVYSTGLTPPEYREYYDKMVIPKNFKPDMAEKIRIFNFMGKMIIDELSFPHKAALVTLKKIMSAKEKPTEMEKLLITLCDTSGDFTDKSSITELIEYAKS